MTNDQKNNLRIRRNREICQNLLLALTLLITFIVMLPFIWMVLMSFKNDTQIVNNPFVLPDFSYWDNYIRALNTLPLVTMYKNTAIIAIASQVITLVVSFSSSFALTRLQFRHMRLRNLLEKYFLIGLMVPVYILLFPIFRTNIDLHLTGTRLGLILPLVATNIAFDTLLFTGFLKDFPAEIEEAAVIDGCNLFQLIRNITLPINKPVLATVTVFNVLYVWNEFPLTVTLISKPELYTVSLGASFFRSQYGMDYSGLVAGTILIIVPQLIFYAFFQKYIIEGLTAGSVKG